MWEGIRGIMSRRKRKHLVLLCFLLLQLFLYIPQTVLAEGQQAITAEAAIVMDMRTGKVLFEKGAYEERPPASLTKVMTAYLALKIGDLQQVATVSEHAEETGESSLNLKAGDEINLENLLYAALLKSANDACVTIAETVMDSESIFVERMNLQAALLGCSNTHFTNTNGLPDENHYSSAYDLAIMTRAAMQNNLFRHIVEQPFYTVKWMDQRQMRVKNTNRLLVEYPGAIGVKTGTTNAAGQCLIAVAKREEQEVIAVILKSKNRFLDAKVLLDYGLSIVCK